MSNAVSQFGNPNLENGPIYPNFDALLNRIASLVQTQQLVFVIDEYSYLAEA
ncbi:hypothetical protein J2Z60_001935 [Lactobacillus colini]|uniref:ATPase n=1 Tax=Lactobacillus colini TaxID=1819254 RepID=A0ABS4MGC5_9LACO|nr:hypothetical protein [Lactobacillus colini]